MSNDRNVFSPTLLWFTSILSMLVTCQTYFYHVSGKLKAPALTGWLIEVSPWLPFGITSLAVTCFMLIGYDVLRVPNSKSLFGMTLRYWVLYMYVLITIYYAVRLFIF